MTTPKASLRLPQKQATDNDNNAPPPPFFYELHRDYIIGLAAKMAVSYEGAVTEHLRVSGVYWSLTALSLLLPWPEVDALMGVTQPAAKKPAQKEEPTEEKESKEPAKEEEEQSIIDWLYTCYDASTGGFGGNTGQDGHMLYTLSAIQILALADQLSSPRFQAVRPAVIDFIVGLQQPHDGSWAGDAWGEIDTRFTYCALSALAQMQALDRVPNMTLAVDYILKCRNLDGGFGCVIGAESHAGQVFTCVGALAIAQALDRLRPDGSSSNDGNPQTSTNDLLDNDETLLGWWLAERQVDSGGLNGRPEKQADVCYSWWILSSLSILGKVSWINGDKLATYILKCQDGEDGGIADRPDDMADVFHTFFGIAGLSLLGHLHQTASTSNTDEGAAPAPTFRRIDPIYALPTDVCQRLKLPGQVIARESSSGSGEEQDWADDRLQQYQQLQS